jgi:hypothetical protein
MLNFILRVALATFFFAAALACMLAYFDVLVAA